MQEMLVRSLGREDPLEEEMATHSSILARKIPQTGLQAMGSQRVRHDLVTEQQQFIIAISWEKKYPQMSRNK